MSALTLMDLGLFEQDRTDRIRRRLKLRNHWWLRSPLPSGAVDWYLPVVRGYGRGPTHIMNVNTGLLLGDAEEGADTFDTIAAARRRCRSIFQAERMLNREIPGRRQIRLS